MHKILYAINHRDTEDAISKRISNEYMPVGAVTYKEAVLGKLKETGADTLLIRETLPGSITLERLLKRARMEYPETRIIVICSERPKQDPFLQALVNLAIYDIINSDKPSLTDICSYILTPRTIRDAAQYGFGLPEVPNSNYTSQQLNNDPAEKKAPGFLDNLIKGFSSLKKPTMSHSSPAHTATEAPDLEIPYDKPQVDLNILRESIRQSEARRAQTDLDHMIRQAVDQQTSALIRENESLKKRLESMTSELSMSESHSSDVIEELNSLRSERDRLKITLNDTRRDMQDAIDMYETQLKALHDPTNTPEWYSKQTELWESQKESLTKSLQEKTDEAASLACQVDLMSRQLKERADALSELQIQTQRFQDTQMCEKGSDELVSSLRAENSELKVKQQTMERELQTAKEELRGIVPDYSQPVAYVPLLPDDTVYTVPNTSPQTILMIGAKHGIGTTTVALNLATSLAGRGYKTLLVEANPSFPMLNSYFEFTHVPYGIDEVLTAIASGDIGSVERAIIRPHGLRPSDGVLAKIYKKLPAGLHFMLFSNESLLKHSYEQNCFLTEATIYTFLGYLTKRLQYSHIILDIQCDDHRLLQSILNSGYPIDKLCMIMTQDPHALMTAGNLITTLSRAHVSSLVASGEFVINRYNPNADTTQKKIEGMLHIGAAQVFKFSEDSDGYLAAIHAGLPYLLNKGRYWMEADLFRGKVCPNS